GDQVYVVLSNGTGNLAMPQSHENADGTFSYETEAEYRARLEQLDISTLLPQYTSEAHDAGTTTQAFGPLEAPTDIFRPLNPGDAGLLSVVAFDAKSKAAGPASAVGVVADYASTVYATADHLYLLSSHWMVSGTDTGSTGQPSTLIRRLDLNG